jgi:hypothetical protein
MSCFGRMSHEICHLQVVLNVGIPSKNYIKDKVFHSRVSNLGLKMVRGNVDIRKNINELQGENIVKGTIWMVIVTSFLDCGYTLKSKALFNNKL